MNPNEYKQRHPLAWFVIGGVLLFAGVSAASLNGWLPIGNKAALVCNECGVVEAVRTVETPMSPSATALEQSVTDDATTATEATGTTGTTGATNATAAAGAAPDSLDPAAGLQFTLSYETTVRYENGTTGVFSQAEPPTWAPGDKIKVVDGMILVAG